ncbi:unnamed protein product, partial [marine sediment metagenome]
HERCGRTNLDTITAEYARRIDHGAIEGRRDVAFESTLSEIKRMHTGDLIAHAHTASAEDAVLMIPDENRVVVLE